MTFPLRLPAELHAQLVREADRLQVSRNALVTIALDHWFSRGGCVADLPVPVVQDQAVGQLSGCALPTPHPVAEKAPDAVSDPLVRDGGSEPVTEVQGRAIYEHGREVGFDKLNGWQKRVYRHYRTYLEGQKAAVRR